MVEFIFSDEIGCREVEEEEEKGTKGRALWDAHRKLQGDEEDS